MLALVANALFGAFLLKEDFESGVPPQGWSRGPNSEGGFNWGGLTGFSTGVAAGSRSWDSTYGELTPNNWLVTPVVDLGSSTGHFRNLQFDVGENYGGEYLTVYIIADTDLTNPANPQADFLAHGTALFDELVNNVGLATWRHVKIALGAYTGDVRFAFRHHNCTDGSWMAVDNVWVFSPDDHDLAITSFSTNTTSLDLDVTSQLTVNATISNWGLNPASGYTVNLWRLGAATPINSVTVNATLAVDASYAYQYSYTPPTGNAVLYLTVDYEADMDFEYNTSNNITVPVYYGSQELIQPLASSTATETSQMYPPALFYNYYNGAQWIYTSAQMGGQPKTITGMALKYTQANAAQNVPVQIRIGNTNVAGFTSNTGWIATNSLTQVFNGTLVNVLPTSAVATGQDIWFEFSQPFNYTGGNLVVSWMSGNGSAYGGSSTTTAWRTKSMGSGNDNQPAIYRSNDNSFTIGTQAQGTRVWNVPVAKFQLYTESVNLFGLVYDNVTNQLIEGATIRSLNDPVVSVTTNALGEYNFATFKTANGGLSAIKSGYLVYNGPTLDESTLADGWGTSTWEYNVLMSPIPLFTVTGTVKKAYDNGGLADVTVQIRDTQGGLYEPVTNTSGVFTVNLPQNTRYSYTIVTQNYVTYTGSFQVAEAALTLPDILLIEKSFNPMLLQAEENAVEGYDVSWLSPFHKSNTFAYGSGTPSFLGLGGTAFEAVHRYRITDMKAGLTAGDVRRIHRVAFAPDVEIPVATYDINIYYSPLPIGTTPGISDDNPNQSDVPITSADNLIYTQAVYDYQLKLGQWNYIDLYEPVDITSFTTGQLLIGIATTYPAGTYPIGAYNANPTSALGDIFLTATGYGLLGGSGFGDWMIAAYTADTADPDGAPAPVALNSTIDIELPSQSISNQQFSSNNFNYELDPLQVVENNSSDYRALTNYKLYRVLTTDYTKSYLEWGAPIYNPTVTTVYDDMTEGGMPPTDPWVYAVVAVYNQGVAGLELTSLPVYSPVMNPVLADITITVKDDDGTTLTDTEVTTIRMTQRTHEAVMPVIPVYDAGTQTFEASGLAYGNWVLSIVADGYQPFSITLNVAGSMNEEAVLRAGSVPLFEESFEGTVFPPLGWLSFDVDNDEYTWKKESPSIAQLGYDGLVSAISESNCRDSDGVCLYPDNWLISPILSFPLVADATLSFAIRSQGMGINEETISVYAITEDISGFNINNFRDLLDDENPPLLDHWSYGELGGDYGMKLLDFTTQTQSWIPIAIPIGELLEYYEDTPGALDNLRIAFRHWKSTDNHFLMLDDIRITGQRAANVMAIGTILADDIAAPSFLREARVFWENDDDQNDTGSTETNGVGAYQFYAAVGATYNLTITKDGYQTVETPVTIDSQIIAPITMKREYTITGSVKDSEGVGIDAVTVTLTNLGDDLVDDADDTVLTPISTNPQGVFTTKVLHEDGLNYAIKINKAHYLAEEDSLLITLPLEEEDAIEFEMHELFTISGFVKYDAAGDGTLVDFADAIVSFENVDEEIFFRGATTISEDADGVLGAYSVEVIKGSYNVLIDALDGTQVLNFTSKVPMAVAASATKDFEILPLYALSGRVYYVEGEAGSTTNVYLNDVSINIHNDEADLYSPFIQKSHMGGASEDEAGHYDGLIHRGSYKITALGFDALGLPYGLVEEPYTTPATATGILTYDIVLLEMPLYSITGVVTYHDDEADEDLPVDSGTVTFTNVNTDLYDPEVAEITIDDTGAGPVAVYEIKAPDGHYNITVEAVAGEWPYGITFADFEVDGQDDTKDFSVERLVYTVTGKVIIVVGEDTTAVGGATVMLENNAAGMNSPADQPTIATAGTTLGTFTFPVVGKGTYTATATVVVDGVPYRFTNPAFVVDEAKDVKFVITPRTYNVAGIVVMEDEEDDQPVEVPVGDAIVTLVHTDALVTNPEPAITIATAGADKGKFGFTAVGEGNYAVTVLAMVEGAPYTYEGTLEVLADVPAAKFIVEVADMYDVEGKVTYLLEGTATIVPEAWVTFTNVTEGLYSPAPTQTDTDGEYALSTTAGDYDVEVYALIGELPYEYFSTTAITIADDEEDVDFALTAATLYELKGVVVYMVEEEDGDGDMVDVEVPFEGATITFANKKAHAYSPAPATSDDTADHEGEFELDTTAGVYTVTVEGYIDLVPYLWTEEVTVTANKADFKFVVAPQLIEVTGTVVNGEGEPFTTATTITFVNTDGEAYQPAAVTTATGAFTIMTVAGEYNVTATATVGGQMYAWATDAEEPFEVGEETEPLEITMELKTWKVIGTVTGVAGETLSGITLKLTDQATTNPVPEKTTTTGEGGAFTFTGVLNATYTLSAHSVQPLTQIPQEETYDLAIAVNNADFTLTTAFELSQALEEADVIGLPTITTLKNNYPNPFNPSTTIAFDIAKDGHVSIEIYNIKGQRVKSLVNDSFRVGRYSVVWNGDDNNGRNVGSGVYFYRMTTSEYRSVKKMLLMK